MGIMNPSSAPSRAPLVLYSIWAFLALRMAIAVVRHESLRDDMLALPLIAFLVLSAVAGGRIYSRLSQRAS